MARWVGMRVILHMVSCSRDLRAPNWSGLVFLRARWANDSTPQAVIHRTAPPSRSGWGTRLTGQRSGKVPGFHLGGAHGAGRPAPGVASTVRGLVAMGRKVAGRKWALTNGLMIPIWEHATGAGA
jgi:hypothetical protein